MYRQFDFQIMSSLKAGLKTLNITHGHTLFESFNSSNVVSEMDISKDFPRSRLSRVLRPCQGTEKQLAFFIVPLPCLVNGEIKHWLISINIPSLLLELVAS